MSGSNQPLVPPRQPARSGRALQPGVQAGRPPGRGSRVPQGRCVDPGHPPARGRRGDGRRGKGACDGAGGPGPGRPPRRNELTRPLSGAARTVTRPDPPTLAAWRLEDHRRWRSPISFANPHSASRLPCAGPPGARAAERGALAGRRSSAAPARSLRRPAGSTNGSSRGPRAPSPTTLIGSAGLAARRRAAATGSIRVGSGTPPDRQGDL